MFNENIKTVAKNILGLIFLFWGSVMMYKGFVYLGDPTETFDAFGMNWFAESLAWAPLSFGILIFIAGIGFMFMKLKSREQILQETREERTKAA